MDVLSAFHRRRPISGRGAGRSGAVVLVAVAGLVVPPAAPAGAATHHPTVHVRGVVHPARVEASLDRTTALYGSPLVVSGAVEDPENPGMQATDGVVELITRDRSGRHVRTVAAHRLHPGERGGFTFDLTADRTNYYIVKYLGGPGLGPADSAPLQFAVQSLIHAEADRTEVHPGQSVTISADILPAVPDEGAWVVDTGKSEYLQGARTDSHGHVTFHITAPDSPGTYSYTVACGVMNGDNQTEGASRPIHITVT
jgi:hypothetical protein